MLVLEDFSSGIVPKIRIVDVTNRDGEQTARIVLSKLQKTINRVTEAMEDCDFMVAGIDDYDTGTVFELGYFTCLKNHGITGLKKINRSIVTITGKDYNLNVMLKFGTDCHLRGLQNLEYLAQDILQNTAIEGDLSEVLIRHNNSPEVKE